MKVPIDRHLENGERLLDVIASWEYGPHKKRQFDLVYKVRLNSKTRIYQFTKEELRLHYLQGAYDVSHG